MREEADDLGFMRDVASHFGTKTSDDELAKFNEGRDPTHKVVLRASKAELTLNEPTFAKLYTNVFADVRIDHRDLSALGVGYLAQAADKLGLAELATRIREFVKQMKGGLALIRRDDGSLWAPTTVSRVPNHAQAAEVEALAVDVEDYFGEDEE